MKKVHHSEIPAEDVREGAVGVRIRWLITETDGAKNFVMRHFTIAPGGNTPEHSHVWEHEVFILEGTGNVLSAEGEKPFAPGDVIFMPGGERHRFANTGETPVKMLCLIPARK